MSTGTVIILGGVIVAIVALGFIPTVRMTSRTLRRRFGPEFQRSVERHGGDVEAARKELSERLYRHGDLRLAPLDAAAREAYRLRWTEIGMASLDAPAPSVVAAEELIRRLAADRGYPDGDAAELADALSVRYARQTGGFRRLCEAAEQVRDGGEMTARLVGVLAGAQGMFEQLASEPPARRPARRIRRGSRVRAGLLDSAPEQQPPTASRRRASGLGGWR